MMYDVLFFGSYYMLHFRYWQKLL